MDHSNVTITLPMTEHGLGVILTALGIGVGTGIVWLILSEQGRAPRNSPATLLGAFAVIMAPVWLVIFAGTLWQVWLMLSGAPSASGPSLGIGALLAALLGAPFLVWGTVLKQRTVDFQKEGHITDRITAAVEQLGAEKTVKKIVDGETQETSEPNIEVRIGAILSLERIAQDSTRYDKGRDHVRVMEILCAYVRENSHARPPRDFPLLDLKPLLDSAGKEDRKTHEIWRNTRFAIGAGNAREWAHSLPKPSADIALALQVLGRRTVDQRRVEAAWPEPPDAATVWPFDTECPALPEINDDTPRKSAQIDVFSTQLEVWIKSLTAYSGYRLDLRGANLPRADLSAKRPNASDAVFAGAMLNGARLAGADLTCARMDGANLTETRLEGADLNHARMDGADLTEARMEGAHLRGARMQGAILIEARMEGVHLHKARMEGALCAMTRLEGAILSEAKLEGANLSFVEMKGAKLAKARIEKANLTAAQLEGADLTAARLEGAELWKTRVNTRTSLKRATFNGAALRKADYCDVGISADQINFAFGDASVILPEGMPRPDHWPDWELPLRGDHAFDTEWRKWQADPDGYVPPPKPDG